MKKWCKFIVAVLVGIAVNALIVAIFILWCKHIDGTQEIINVVTPTPTAAIESDLSY